jgi:hypothetical protein
LRVLPPLAIERGAKELLAPALRVMVAGLGPTTLRQVMVMVPVEGADVSGV